MQIREQIQNKNKSEREWMAKCLNDFIASDVMWLWMEQNSLNALYMQCVYSKYSCNEYQAKIRHLEIWSKSAFSCQPMTTFLYINMSFSKTGSQMRLGQNNKSVENNSNKREEIEITKDKTEFTAAAQDTGQFLLSNGNMM